MLLSRIPTAAPPTSGPAGRRAGPQAIPLDRNAGDEATPIGPLASELHPHCQATSLPLPSLPIRIPAARPRAGQRACGRGHRRSPLDRNAGDERPGRPPWRAAFIRAANPNPYRRHRRQAASLLPPHERPAGMRPGRLTAAQTALPSALRRRAAPGSTRGMRSCPSGMPSVLMIFSKKVHSKNFSSSTSVHSCTPGILTHIFSSSGTATTW